MSPRFLLDTHVVVRWLSEPKRLSREQTRVLQDAVHRGEPLALSAMTLLEIALLFTGGAAKLHKPKEELFEDLRSGSFQILPLTIEIATEVAQMSGSLRDPADRAIVATARVHNLRLLTSDQRIIESKLVGVLE